MNNVAMQAAPQVIRAERCEKCRWLAVEQGDMFCHRQPPSVQIMRDQRGAPTPVSAFPPVGPTQFCGEFKPRLEGVS